jgi:hypothetical protein
VAAWRATVSDGTVDPMTTPPTPRRSNGGRIAAYIGAAFVGLLALVLLAAGGLALWANGKKDDDGYLTTKSERFATSTYALATDDLDIDAEGGIVDADRYGKLRLKAQSRAGKPLFVGIARSEDVARYLGATAHAELTDVETDPFRAQYRPHAGASPQTLPSQQRFWAASTQGSNRQTLTWDVEHGSWSVVVMNADGSRGVDAGVSAGADLPVLTPLGWGLLGGGALLALLAAGLVVVGVRSPAARVIAAPA